MVIFICAGCGQLVMPGTEATMTKGRHRRPVKMHKTCWDAKRSGLKNAVHLAMTKHYKEIGASCVKCGSTEEIEADHIVSRSEGGTSRVENYQPLCKKCNASKG